MRIVTFFSHALGAAVLVGFLALGCSCPQPAATTTPHAGGSTDEPATPITDEPAIPAPEREPESPADEPDTGEDGEQAPASQLPGRGVPCVDGACAKGLTCVEYYGIAGARGPKFSSCENPCDSGAACPPGLTCITIADGPGQVCRPRER
jgi:hypothetical protein